MTWGMVAGGILTAALAFSMGVGVGRLRRRGRLRRIAEGASELARGNLAHRIFLSGSDDAALAAETLNALADDIQRERAGARSRDAARRQLLADISHDLRTPITSIAGYTDALQRGLGEEPERYLGVIAAKAEALVQLTDDLFYAARIDAGDLDLTTQTVDLAETARRSVLGFEPQLAESGARIVVRIPDARCDVAADPSALARVLTNLVSNAIQHGGGMRHFILDVETTADSHTLRVANDGGPLPANAERLFQRGATGPAGGTGLGLAIARELAERMGGSLGAESDRDGMAAFVLSMPRVEFRES